MVILKCHNVTTNEGRADIIVLEKFESDRLPAVWEHSVKRWTLREGMCWSIRSMQKVSGEKPCQGVQWGPNERRDNRHIAEVVNAQSLGRCWQITTPNTACFLLDGFSKRNCFLFGSLDDVRVQLVGGQPLNLATPDLNSDHHWFFCSSLCLSYCFRLITCTPHGTEFKFKDAEQLVKQNKGLRERQRSFYSEFVS